MPQYFRLFTLLREQEGIVCSMWVSTLQATFKSVAEEQQHLSGPTHRKALIRQQAEQELKSRIANSRDAAHSAVVSGAA